MNRLIATSTLGLLFFYLEISDGALCLSPEINSLDMAVCNINNLIGIYDHKYYWGIGLTLCFIGINFYWDNRQSNKTKNNINDILDLFFIETLYDDRENHRVTIFKKVKNWNAFFYYCYSTILKLKYYYNCGKLYPRLKQCPIPFTSYLIAYSRFGYPNQEIMSTIIRTHSNIDDVDCFAEYVFKLKKPDYVDLLKLKNVNLGNITKFSEVKVSSRSSIKKYMDGCKIRKFDTFRMFSRHTPHLAAIPLYTKKRSMNSPSFIVVYDSETVSYTKIEQELNRISKYIEAILINR